MIPTRDRPGALELCVDALSRQTISDELELIVVDDRSDDPDAVARAVERFPRVTLIRGQARGPAAARNLGVASTRGRYVLLTDDDCCPTPAWAERMRAVLERGAVAVAGATVNGDARSALAEASQLVANSLVLPLPDDPTSVSFAPSNNIACRGELLRALPFDETYSAAGGEDRDWCSRVIAAGHAIRFEPAARVLHFQRLQLRSFWSQQLRYGRGAYRSRRDRPGGIELEPAAFYLRLLAQGARRGPRVAAYLVLAQLATAVGFAAEALRAARAVRAA